MANKEATLLLKFKTMGEEAWKKVVVTFGDIINLAGKLVDAMAAPIRAFEEAERSTNALTQSMINAGVYSQELKKAYLEEADALSRKTRFGDDEIVQAQTAIQAKIGNIRVSEDLIKATLDLATAEKMDLVGAAELVGKAIGTSTNALARQGVQVDANASKQEKLLQVIAGINKQHQGQAEAAAQGLGVLTLLNNRLGEMVELIGKAVAPAVAVFGRSILNSTIEIEKAEEKLGTFNAAAQFTAKTIVVVFETLKAFAKGVKDLFITPIEAVSALMEGRLLDAFRGATIGKFEKMGANVATAYENIQTRFAELDKAYLASQEENAKKEEKLLKDTLAAKQRAKIEADNADTQQKMQKQISDQEAEIAMIGANDEQKLALQIRAADEAYKAATSHKEKMKALEDKHYLLERQRDLKEKELEDKKNEELYQSRLKALNSLASLQHSKSRELAAIGKAAAIVEIGINTHKAAMAANAALAGIPVVGPALGMAAAGALIAYGAERAASVAGIQLAEGGIVKARPGGIQATIGEGGQDEAVIPLDKAGGMLGGPTVFNFTVYGGMLGDESSAYQFIKAIDKGFLELRRNNESKAFDAGVV